MTTHTWAAAQGNFFDAGVWVGHSSPRPGDIAVITAGDARLAHSWLRGETVVLAGYVANVPTIELWSGTVAADSAIEAFQGGGQGRIDITGQTTNYGLIEAADYQPFFGVSLGSTLDVNLGVGLFCHCSPTAVLVNNGTLEADHHSTLRVHAASTGDLLVNNGTIASLGHTVLDVTVSGAGVIQLGGVINGQSSSRAVGLLEVDRGIDPGQTIRFAPGAGLQINDLPEFGAVISGFAYDRNAATQGFPDTIKLTAADITSLRYDATASGGVLNLLEGTQVAGRISFAGAYTKDSFVLTHIGADSFITPKPV